MDDQSKKHSSGPEMTGSDLQQNQAAGLFATPEKRRRNQFSGSFVHTIDAKGRLVVPQGFRALLGEKFFVAPSGDFRAIGLYSIEQWEKTSDDYMNLALANESLRPLSNMFHALSYGDQEYDSQGRVLLPSLIRSRILGDDNKEMEISGAGDHVRVTTLITGEKQYRELVEQLPDLLQTISATRMRQSAMKNGTEMKTE